MSLFKKKADPISERSRMLEAEIAALEAKIQKLDAQVSQPASQPRLRSTAMPHRGSSGTGVSPVRSDTSRACETPASLTQHAAPAEPVFEEVDQNKLKPKTETPSTRNHYNDLGVRKYDLHGFIQRIKNHFNPQPPTNPKLVSYLAAGSFQGLRPLRYEKRVARNRFILLVTILFLALLGILLVFLKNH